MGLSSRICGAACRIRPTSRGDRRRHARFVLVEGNPVSLRVSISFLAVWPLALGLACGKKEVSAPPPLEVVVATVEKQDVEIRSEWVGTITGYVNADIRPKVEGYLLRQVYRDGSAVETGDLLFEIDPRQYQADLDEAKGQVARTRALLVRHQNDVRRYTPLAAEGAVSQKELDDAVQNLAAAKAQLAADLAALENARLNLEWTKVLSPIAGIAGIAQAQVGDLVKPISLLTQVSQLDPIKVSFPVSEVEYLKFARRNPRRDAEGVPRSGGTQLELILADGSTYPEKGRVDVAGLGVTATTGTIEIQGVFPNTDNLLRPGQFAKVRAVTERFPDALVVPQRAVRDLQGLMQVARVGDDNKVEFVNVELGPATGSRYVVKSGLKSGDVVVTEGLQKIRDGLEVKPKPPEEPGAAKAAS
jgi:membrane fusion protein (multidrug efflux system)